MLYLCLSSDNMICVSRTIELPEHSMLEVIDQHDISIVNNYSNFKINE